MLALRIVLSVPFWFLRLAVLLLFAILGLPLILWQIGNLETRTSRHFPNRMLLQFHAKWMGLYCNDEDGVDGLRGVDPAQQWWADKTAGWSPQKRIFIWSAIRNPVDSLRWLPLINPKIDPTRVRYVGMDREPQDGESGWYFAWQGLYSCIRWEFELRGRFYRFWLGNKLKPEDRLGLHEGDVRAIRCDFAAQFKRVA